MYVLMREVLADEVLPLRLVDLSIRVRVASPHFQVLDPELES